MAEKDRWDKLDILMKPLGGLITGAVLAGISFATTDFLKTQESERTKQMAAQQKEETNLRLYTQIMSGREKADTDLRREMFKLVIDAFLKDGLSAEKGLSEKVLALELLAFNFHDVIDIAPLFKFVANAIQNSKDKQKEDLYRQLQNAAGEVIDKQLASLSEGGEIATLSIDFGKIKEEGFQSFEELIYPVSEGSDEERYILVEAMEVYPGSREIKIRLDSGIADGNKRYSEIDQKFSVGFFDFPLIDNTRVSHSRRIGVALTRWYDGGIAHFAHLKVVYFPASRAGLKEKPYYDEVINQLRLANEAVEEGGPNEK